jgi:phosphoglycerate kinase
MTGTFKTLDQTGDLSGKRVLVRADLNMPMENGQVSDMTRLSRVVPTLAALAAKGAKVIVLSHLGRPKKAGDPAFSLRPLVAVVSASLKRDVLFCPEVSGPVFAEAVSQLNNGDVLLVENTRFDPREEANDQSLVADWAAHADLYVNDAFSCAHRAHASTEGLAHHLPSFAGLAMQAELEALALAVGHPKRPVIALVGGAKIASKIDLLNNLVTRVDVLVIGGGMANTFLAARGVKVGASLCERDLGPTARAIEVAATRAGCKILLPIDAVVAKEFKPHADARTISVDLVPDDAMILDIGSATVAAIATALEAAKTVVWNGPLGAFEVPPFDTGTANVARLVAMLTRAGRVKSVAGGGDTVAALNHAGAASGFSYVSTAGGAFLEWLEGKELPGVAALAA